jgi:hypothetical protein
VRDFLPGEDYDDLAGATDNEEEEDGDDDEGAHPACEAEVLVLDDYGEAAAITWAIEDSKAEEPEWAWEGLDIFVCVPAAASTTIAADHVGVADGPSARCHHSRATDMTKVPCVDAAGVVDAANVTRPHPVQGRGVGGDVVDAGAGSVPAIAMVYFSFCIFYLNYLSMNEFFWKSPAFLVFEFNFRSPRASGQPARPRFQKNIE